jgi:hypothetical protein
MRRLLAGPGCLLLACLGAAPAAAPPPRPAVAASVESTLTSARGSIRQFAFDGDRASFFASAESPSKKDHFTLRFDAPVRVRSVLVVTGRPGGGDELNEGVLEAAADKDFAEVARFAGGAARWAGKGRAVRALRVRPSADLKHPLVIREVVVDSEPAVAVFRYPVEFVVRAETPQMREWAENAARQCTRWYPRICEELKGDGFRPPRVVRLTLSSRYNGVAYASGDRITGSVKYFTEHPGDVGAMIHETVHVVQGYRRGGNPGWLVEGIADYVRFYRYEPGKAGRLSRRRARYDGSYRTTAAFLAYLSEKYDPHIVRKLNAVMRAGDYREGVFQQLTGKTVQALGEEWRASLGR